MQVGNYRKAMKWVVEAKKIANPLPVALYEVSAQASLALGDLSTATNSIKGAINVGGATLQRVMFYGDLLLRSGQLQVAADVFQQVIREQDSYPLAWKGLAHCLFHEPRTGEGISLYRWITAGITEWLCMPSPFTVEERLTPLSHDPAS